MFDANKLLNQMFGAGGGKNPLGDIGGMLGGLLNDSVAGMKEGAAAIEQKTGIGAKANEALKDATGKSGGDLFEQAKAFATENKVAAGAALGGLGLLLLGTRGGRGLAGSAATLGGLAMVGGSWAKQRRATAVLLVVAPMHTFSAAKVRGAAAAAAAAPSPVSREW